MSMRTEPVTPPVTKHHSVYGQFFPTDSQVLLVSDSAEIRSYEADQGISVSSYEELIQHGAGAHDSVVVVRTQGERGILNEELAPSLSHCRTLVIPLASFGRSFEDYLYFRDLLHYIDLPSTCDQVQSLVGWLQNVETGMRITDPSGTDLEIVLSDSIDLMTPKFRPVIEPGELISIARYIEVALIPTDFTDTYVIDGDYMCNGVSIAIHLVHFDDLPLKSDEVMEKMCEWRTEELFPLRLHFTKGKLTSVMDSQDNEHIDYFLPVVDPETGNSPVEVAISTLSFLPGFYTDWSRNSQINEASGGVHIAIGTGVNGLHIDFVNTAATIASL